ncbi:CNNM domain-containing protein [Kocuria rosea]|uniref:CNNM domain-containing protein n=1 Tax=Kocuria rosea TaxID=1275 RepID=UPI003AFABD96
MIAAALTLLLGIVVILAIIAANGYFVAQEFAYMSVDRARLGARAEAGDKAAQRALKVTRRTSFMLSGAQLGITVTGLLIGYVAEPLVGESLAVLLGSTGVPAALSISVGTVAALVVAAVVQMIFGELHPKNLAIANPEDGTPGLVHVPDTLLEPPGRPVRELSHPAFVLETDTPVYEALARIREAGEQLAAVRHDGRFVGVITLSDVLRRVLPMDFTPAAQPS